ncbi:MAG: hypothetical protein ACTHMT_16230 [Verrucomicrobiota bacterium]
MRYLVKASLKPGKLPALLRAIQDGSLGQGSVAGHEYLENMRSARLTANQQLQWVETCFCRTPLEEERPYWEQFLNLLEVKDAHSRRNCRHENGTEPWACFDCDCTRNLEQHLAQTGQNFLESVSSQSPNNRAG